MISIFKSALRRSLVMQMSKYINKLIAVVIGFLIIYASSIYNYFSSTF